MTTCFREPFEPVWHRKRLCNSWDAGKSAGEREGNFGDLEVLASTRMELAIQIQVEELPEGLFLATSDELPGLVAQGRTVSEALEIARDVARRLIEAQRERDGGPDLPTTHGRRHYTIVVAA
jgi:predicted RNase H-like HicB family nuclease